MDMAEKTRENRLRRIAQRQGLRMMKSRSALSLDNFGGYMLIDASINGVVRGSRFDADLGDIDEFLNGTKPDPKRRRLTAPSR